MSVQMSRVLTIRYTVLFQICYKNQVSIKNKILLSFFWMIIGILGVRGKIFFPGRGVEAL